MPALSAIAAGLDLPAPRGGPIGARHAVPAPFLLRQHARAAAAPAPRGRRAASILGAPRGFAAARFLASFLLQQREQFPCCAAYVYLPRPQTGVLAPFRRLPSCSRAYSFLAYRRLPLLRRARMYFHSTFLLLLFFLYRAQTGRRACSSSYFPCSMNISMSCCSNAHSPPAHRAFPAHDAPPGPHGHPFLARSSSWWRMIAALLPGRPVSLLLLIVLFSSSPVASWYKVATS